MQESPEVETWLYGLFAGDATMHGYTADRWHNGVAPEGTQSPYGIFAYHAGHDVRGVGPARIMSSTVYQVKIVATRENYANQRLAASRIDALLQAASGTTAAGRILACVRESEVNYKEVSNGVEYRHLGGLYRIYVQPL